jgi:glucose-specific phosphotransferase system IIA component
MLNFFKSKKKDNENKVELENSTNETKGTLLYAPAEGRLISIEEVNDAVFSKKLLGDGYAVIPSTGEIVSPVDGVIDSIFPTKHAFGIKTIAGDEIILHIGIDTVELNGEPFEVFVKQGDKVQAGVKLAEMSIEKLKGKDPTTMVVFSNQNIESILLEEKGAVIRGEIVGKVIHK